MKQKLLVLTCATVSLVSSAGNAYVDQTCAKQVLEQCMTEEKNKSDSERFDQSAAEYCSAVAVTQCAK